MSTNRDDQAPRAFDRRTLLKSGSLGAAATLLRAAPAGAATASDGSRVTNWEHRRGTLGGIWEVWRGDKASDNVPWEKVQVPHCFNARDAVDPDDTYYQGHGWYRTSIPLAARKPGSRLLLHFEGAGQRSEVYVWMEKVGEHLGGYDEFSVDITDALARAEKRGAPKGQIPVAVLCDNSRDLERIPSSLSDFVLYGGLYRHVHLQEVPAVSLARLYVDSKAEPGLAAHVTVSAQFRNPTGRRDPIDVRVQISGPLGQVLDKTMKVVPGNGRQQLLGYTAIDRPELWSPARPALYTCQVVLGGEAQSAVSTRFGLRHFEFKKQGPFFLNGERLLLRGTHRHEDHAGLGAALTDEIVRRELTLIKEMGANFIRLGHYQQSRLTLDLCDELGLLVWEEIPWCRGGLGGQRYRQQARAMLESMIDQHRNHPSVILWGLGNENDWPGDFEVFDQKAIRAFMTELHQLAHKIDPSRKTAIRRCDFCKDVVDVYSPSIWAGWYRGQYTEYKPTSETEMKKVNHFLHVEWGGDSHAGRFAEDTDRILAKIATGQGADERGDRDYLLTGGQARASKDGDWSETYICNLFDWHLKEQETMPWLTGTAQWVFKDFATPLRPENPVPRVNQKGLVERDLTPKDGYYVFQSYWSQKPMARIAGHRFAVRWGERDEQKMVKVYSNCAEAELFLNGRSLGTKKRNAQDFPAAGLRWMTKFKEGDNHLQVRARAGQTVVEDEIRFRYQTQKWGKPARLLLSRVKEATARAGVAAVQARLVDGKGVACLDSRLAVRFDLAGGGRLLDNLGTNGGSRKVELTNGRALIAVELASDPAALSVSGPGVAGALLTLPATTVGS